MTPTDWQTGFAKSLGVFLNGDALPDPDPHGNRVADDTFLCPSCRPRVWPRGSCGSSVGIWWKPFSSAPWKKNCRFIWAMPNTTPRATTAVIRGMGRREALNELDTAYPGRIK
jgi:hypothetical protein